MIILGSLIEQGRKKKNLSQRKLAKIIKVSHSTLNDLEKGKVKKPNVDVLRKISEELDLNLEKLMLLAGYGKVVDLLTCHK